MKTIRLARDPCHEDQENEEEDERDGEECKVESRRETKTHNHSMRMKLGLITCERIVVGQSA